MSKEKITEEILYWGTELYNKGLVIGTSGNISKRVDDGIYITAHNSYLGYLDKDDVLLIDKFGNPLPEGKEPTSEILLHTGIYKNLSDNNVVIHAHPPYTSYFFNYFDKIEVTTFEEKLYIGNFGLVLQNSPTVIDIKPVIQAFEINNIVVLKRHGVVAIGKDFKSAFSLIYLLETNAKLNLQYNFDRSSHEKIKENNSLKRSKLFSEDHILTLVQIINNDEKAQKLGKEYNLSTVLTVKDNKHTITFYYENGKIVKVDNDDNASEFVFSAKSEVWKQIFNRENDPFVAYSQGKIKLKGDFNKLSNWFPAFERTFELWGLAPVE